MAKVEEAVLYWKKSGFISSQAAVEILSVGFVAFGTSDEKFIVKYFGNGFIVSAQTNVRRFRRFGVVTCTWMGNGFIKRCRLR